MLMPKFPRLLDFKMLILSIGVQKDDHKWLDYLRLRLFCSAELPWLVLYVQPALLMVQEIALGMGLLFRWNHSLPNSFSWKLRAGNVISYLIKFYLLLLKLTLKQVSEGQPFRSYLCLYVHKISKQVFSSQTQWIPYFSQVRSISFICRCASSPKNAKGSQKCACSKLSKN